MAYTVTIGFTGLCAFVEHETEKRVKVLLVDGRPQSDLMHVCPTVRFDREDLDSDPQVSRQPDLTRDGDTLLTKDSLCFLDQEDLTIEAVDGNILSAALEIERTPPDGQPPEQATEDNRRLFDWVVDLEDLQPGAGTPAPGWFQTPPAGAIVARITLDKGTLYTEDFLRSKAAKKGEVTEIDFFPVHESERPFPSRISWMFELEDESRLKIASTSWAGGSNRHLVFKPRADPLEIEVWNTPFFDIMESFFPGDIVPEKKPNSWSKTFGKGQSFKHFYRLTGVQGAGLTSKMSNVKLLNHMLSKGYGCSPAKTRKFNFQ